MNKQVTIMYSGGMDSYIAYYYAKSLGMSPICIYLDMGHEYSQKELDVIQNLPFKVHILDFRTLFPLLEQTEKMTNQIIPSRNVLLAVLGSMFSDRVWINALDGEQNGKEHDKSEKFFTDVSSLLTYTNDFFQESTIVESPFAKMSKAEIIEWALTNGITKEELLSTVSCYSGEVRSCGTCLTCVKRHIAFKLNGIEDGNYETVINSDYFKELLREIPMADRDKDYSRFTPKRIDEFKKYINTHYER